MYELSNKLRLINVHDYCIKNSSEFIGFILGLISQDNDLEKVYLDSFLTIACTDEDECENVLNQLDDLSNRFHIDFVVSISLNDSLLTEERRKNVLIRL